MQEVVESLMTAEVKALVGQSTDVMEMYDVVDKESIRRFVTAIPDQDPRHWDEALARPRYGGVTMPPAMISLIAGRQYPDAEDRLNEAMLEDWFRDGAGGGRRAQQSRTLTPVRSLVRTHTHLHTGDEMEFFRYPKLGDKIFYQTRYSDILEKKSRSGRPMLMVTTETRYWNQNNETILVFRTTGMEM
jgi:acyl dehydratase